MGFGVYKVLGFRDKGLVHDEEWVRMTSVIGLLAYDETVNAA